MSCIRMKKYVILLLLTVLLLLVIMLMTSCGQKKAAGTNAGGEAASDLRGNYLETSIDLPDEMTYITDFKQLSDGSLCLMTFDEKDRDIVSWVSTDEGKNWIEKERYMKKIPLDISRPEIVEAYR